MSSERQGRLTVVRGCMFAGKTTRLLDAALGYKPVEVMTFKPSTDTRALGVIASHDGRRMGAKVLAPDASMDIFKYLTPSVKLVLIDEVQFFAPTIVDAVERLMLFEIDVMCAGLPTDFLRRPFGAMPQLLAIADVVVSLEARCNKCGEPANCTQRMVNGKPASAKSPLVMVGGSESYEARCKNCHSVGV